MYHGCVGGECTSPRGCDMGECDSMMGVVNHRGILTQGYTKLATRFKKMLAVRQGQLHEFNNGGGLGAC